MPHKTKMRRIHSIPLSRQALAILETIEHDEEYSSYLFPSLRSADRPMSENSINAALRRMTVRTDDGRSVAFVMKDYAPVDHGYAATIHKAPGRTVDRAHMLATPGSTVTAPMSACPDTGTARLFTMAAMNSGTNPALHLVPRADEGHGKRL